ncbi:MAG TPA: TPM domain-containing protein [Usitatibacter sp.]|nr:TPM domain-containing protein [Usitatibacter sp.]
MLRKILAAAALFVGAAGALAAPADPNEIAVPRLSAHVIDETATLTPDQRAALDAKLADFDRTHGSQVVVLLVPSTGEESIFDFATRVTDEWQLGRKGVDDGVLLVVAKAQHKIRIHTGRGVQGTLTDALSNRIINEIIAPRFRAGDFAGGLDAGVDAIVKAIEGESLPLPQAREPAHRVGSASSLSNFLFLAFFVVPFVGLILRGVFGRLFGAGLTSGITGIAAWLVFGSLGLVVFAALASFVFTVLTGTGIGRGIRAGPGWGGGFGGGFGGGGFSGGGGGGFSGGGGSFDGGGSSGSW